MQNIVVGIFDKRRDFDAAARLIIVYNCQAFLLSEENV
jgi:hypothetical protein